MQNNLKITHPTVSQILQPYQRTSADKTITKEDNIREFKH